MIDTLLSEIEVGGHHPGLMVASQEVDRLGVLQFVGEEKSNDLDAEGPSVDVVAQKEVLLG